MSVPSKAAVAGEVPTVISTDSGWPTARQLDKATVNQRRSQPEREILEELMNTTKANKLTKLGIFFVKSI